MAREQKWEQFGPVALTLDGGADGKITVPSTIGLHTKQMVIFTSTTLQSVSNLEVKKVLSETEFLVGKKGDRIDQYQDMSAFTVADGATVMSKEQPRPSIQPHEVERSTFQEEPTVARRTYNVDRLGNGYTSENPFPVKLSDGNIDIGTVNAELEVQLSRKDNDPDAGDVADSVRIGNQDGELTYTVNDDSSKYAADVIALNRLIDVPHDDVEITAFNADGDPETIEFREGGNLKLTLNLSYNTDGDLQRVQRIKP